MNSTGCVSFAFLGLDDTRLDDALVMTKHGLDTSWFGKLADLNISTKFIHFVLNVGI